MENIKLIGACALALVIIIIVIIELYYRWSCSRKLIGYWTAPPEFSEVSGLKVFSLLINDGGVGYLLIIDESGNEIFNGDISINYGLAFNGKINITMGSNDSEIFDADILPQSQLWIFDAGKSKIQIFNREQTKLHALVYKNAYLSDVIATEHE